MRRSLRATLGYALLFAGSLAASVLWIQRERSATGRQIHVGLRCRRSLQRVSGPVAWLWSRPGFRMKQPVRVYRLPSRSAMRVLAQRSLTSTDPDEVPCSGARHDRCQYAGIAGGVVAPGGCTSRCTSAPGGNHNPGRTGQAMWVTGTGGSADRARNARHDGIRRSWSRRNLVAVQLDSLAAGS